MQLTDEHWQRFAEKDDDERDQSMLHALAGGARCCDISWAADRMDFCLTLERDIREHRHDGMMVVPNNDESLMHRSAPGGEEERDKR